MPPNLALLISTIFVIVAFRSDRKRGVTDTSGLIWPTLWYLVASSRSMGYWLVLWGVAVPGDSEDPTEGNIVDRCFLTVLTVIGLWILSRRRCDWVTLYRRNLWFTAFVAFMALSLAWSDYPFVSFKRLLKVVGSIVMALVILTKPDPLEAFSTVLRRCLYIHLPMSIICTKYFREIGVSFDWSGTGEAWMGIATSKNTLGQVAMLGVLYFFWEVRRHWQEYKWRNLHILYLIMAVFLLKGSDQAISMTSVSVCVFALVVFLGIQSLRSRPEFVRRFSLSVFSATVALIVLVLMHSVVMFSEDSIFGQVIALFGRDITLTDRIYIWSDVYAVAAGNPMFGVGFGGFWIGRLVNIPWNASMSWTLAQAHSGYVETYLQLGFIGAFLLAGLLFATMPKLLASLYDDFDFGCFRITLFLTILFVDIVESVYLRGDHHLWLIFLIVLLNVPKVAEVQVAQFEEADEDNLEDDQMEEMPSRS